MFYFILFKVYLTTLKLIITTYAYEDISVMAMLSGLSGIVMLGISIFLMDIDISVPPKNLLTVTNLDMVF